MERNIASYTKEEIELLHFLEGMTPAEKLEILKISIDRETDDWSRDELGEILLKLKTANGEKWGLS